jgi:hypothetical protein
MRLQQIQKPRERYSSAAGGAVYRGWIKATAWRSVGGNELGGNQNATLSGSFASQTRREELVRNLGISISVRPGSLRVRQSSLSVLRQRFESDKARFRSVTHRFQSAISPSGPSDDPPARKSGLWSVGRGFETDNPSFRPADDTSYAPIVGFGTQTIVPAQRSPLSLLSPTLSMRQSILPLFRRHFRLVNTPPARHPQLESVGGRFESVGILSWIF